MYKPSRVIELYFLCLFVKITNYPSLDRLMGSNSDKASVYHGSNPFIVKTYYVRRHIRQSGHGVFTAHPPDGAVAGCVHGSLVRCAQLAPEVW